MEELFLQILNMSFTAGIVILAVIAVRFLLHKTPKLFSYALWIIVLFRLVCPFSLESVLSLLPTNPAPVPTDIVYSATPRVNTGITAVDRTISASLPAPVAHTSVNPLQIWVSIGTAVWIFGMAALLIYSAISLIRLKRLLRGALCLFGNVYQCERLHTPFVMGVFRPRIYLPSTLTESERQYILLHERTHIRRLDHIMKLFSFLVLCIHWFNPLVWVAFFLSGRDMEQSCDEAVIKQLGSDTKKEYSSLLLSLATGRRIVAGVPLAFGEGDTKGRIKHVLRYRKPAFWVIAAAISAFIIVSVVLILNPVSSKTTTVTFPAYSGGQTEYNVYKYDIKPFSVTMELPRGWTVREPEDTEQSGSSLFTPMHIYSGNTYKGYIAYNTFTIYDETTDGNYYRMVYNELMLGSVENWDNAYTPVNETEAGETATCRLSVVQLEEGKSAAESIAREYPAILSYNKDLLVYVAVQFEESAVSGEQLTEIAKSIVIKDAPDAVPIHSGFYNSDGLYDFLAANTYQSKDYSNISVKDSSGNDISRDMILLWMWANEIYNVDDNRMFKMGKWSRIINDAPEFVEILNYDEVVDKVFTAKGKEMLENAPITHIVKQNGRVYRLGPYKTGYFYSAALDDMQVKEMSSDRIVFTVKYVRNPGYVVEADNTSYVPEYDYIDFPVVKSGGRWLVDDYIFIENKIHLDNSPYFSIITDDPLTTIPTVIMFGRSTDKDKDVLTMLRELENMEGFIFAREWAIETDRAYVKFDFEEKPKSLYLRYIAGGGSILQKEYPIDKDYRIKVPTEEGVYNFFADIVWENGKEETVYFSMTMMNGYEAAYYNTLRWKREILPAVQTLLAHYRGDEVSTDAFRQLIKDRVYPSDFPPAAELPEVFMLDQIAIRYNGEPDSPANIYAAIAIDNDHELRFYIKKLFRDLEIYDNVDGYYISDVFFVKRTEKRFLDFVLTDVDLYAKIQS